MFTITVNCVINDTLLIFIMVNSLIHVVMSYVLRFDTVDSVTGRATATACKNPALPIFKSSSLKAGGLDLTWNSLRKNRPAKQNPKIVMKHMILKLRINVLHNMRMMNFN